MATSRKDTGSWKVSSLIKKDFRQDHGDGPEEISRSSKRKSTKWCKGKTGREHVFEWKTYHSYWYGPQDDRKLHESKTWTCKKCGKRDHIKRYRPVKDNAKHKHIYSRTEIVSEASFYSILYEICEICGRHGKSEFFWD